MTGQWSQPISGQNFPISQAFVGTSDMGIRIVEPSKLDILARLTHHTAGVRRVQPVGQGSLVSVAGDNTIQAWQWTNVDKGFHLAAIQGGLLFVFHLCV